MPSEALWSHYFDREGGRENQGGRPPGHFCIERAGHEAQVKPRGPAKPGSSGMDSGDTEVEKLGGTSLLGAAVMSAFSENSGLVPLRASLLYLCCMTGPGLSPLALKNSGMGCGRGQRARILW